MCTTIQIALPADAAEAWAGDSVRIEALGQVEAVPMALISNDNCECGTPLASAAPPREWDQAVYARAIKRFRREGWSEHRIRRWFDAKRTDHSRAERLSQERANGPSAQPVDDWLRFLEAMLKRHSHVGLRVCHGDDSWSEPISRKALPLRDANATALREMEEGTLYVFTK